jgi:hypothetical protein
MELVFVTQIQQIPPIAKPCLVKGNLLTKVVVLDEGIPLLLNMVVNKPLFVFLHLISPMFLKRILAAPALNPKALATVIYSSSECTVSIIENHQGSVSLNALKKATKAFVYALIVVGEAT